MGKDNYKTPAELEEDIPVLDLETVLGADFPDYFGETVADVVNDDPGYLTELIERGMAKLSQEVITELEIKGAM